MKMTERTICSNPNCRCDHLEIQVPYNPKLGEPGEKWCPVCWTTQTYHIAEPRTAREPGHYEACYHADAKT